MYRQTIKFTFILFCFLSACSYAAQWQKLDNGIQYLEWSNEHYPPWARIHIFKIDLKSNQFELLTASKLNKSLAWANEFAQYDQGLIAINGGFFDKSFKPIGLRINQSETLSPFKPISWWGVFYIENQAAHLVSSKDYDPKKTISFAIQSGPRLLVNHHMMPLKEDYAQRSALGITPNGSIILLVTEHLAMTTTELAKIMQSPPLNCCDALNLDGGSSSQMEVHIDEFIKNIQGFTPVSDAIIVKHK